MPTIGNITVPEPAISATPWPVEPEYPSGRAHTPQVVVHRMGPNSANGKVSQRYLLGSGAKQFTVRRTNLTFLKRQDLLDFWIENRGAEGSFSYDAPNEDGTTTEYLVRFKDPELTLEHLYGSISSVGIELVEVPTANPEYAITDTLLRFPTDGLEDALAAQVQEIIPLIRIEATDAEYPVIYLSDRRCIVGEQQYEPRLLDWAGIEQSMDGASDQASFTLGNADKVFTELVNEVDLFRADIQFSLYHVGSGFKLDLWRGDVTDWKAGAASDTISISASDGFYELNQSYPRRKISRTCWKKYNDAANGCPWEDESNTTHTSRTLPKSDGSTRLYEFTPDASKCDKSFDGPNGCLAHEMESRFGGIIAYPQNVRTKDNGTGVWGIGRSMLTSTSLIADSIYGEVIPEIYCDVQNPDSSIGFPVNCKIAAGRDEGDFYSALGIVGEGPIVEYAAPRFTTLGTSPPYNPHKLDGQDHHGFIAKQPNNYGLRAGDITGELGTYGRDPVPAGSKNNFSLGEGGAGIQRYGPERAAGTAFIEIRRTDEKGLQLSRLEEHSMQTAIRKGLAVWTWSDGVRSETVEVSTNPIWIAVNVVLRARGLFGATAEEQEAVFDVDAAELAAGVCDETVTKMIGTGTETQFTFTGILGEAKPTRDWLQEILNNCLGYYTFAFDKIKFGIRFHSGAAEQFSDGNIIWGSLEYEPLKPSFWHITGQFADEEYAYVSNSVEIYDETYGEQVGGVPMRSQMNFAGASSKSQVARLITTRLREETGGWRPEVQKVARRGRFKTTLLGLSVEPGTVCRIDHEDMPNYPATAEGSPDPEEARSNHIQLRVGRWRLNKDYSIDVEWRSLHNEIYELVSGPKPSDVALIPLPIEETFAPANWQFHAHTNRDGLLRLNNISVRTNKETVHRGTFEVYHANEATNAYGTLVGSISDSDTEFPMSGHPPIDGRWLQIDRELMYVEVFEPGATELDFGTVTVRRGQLGTTAVAHTRVECTVLYKDSANPCHLRVEPGLDLRPGTNIVVNDGGGPPYDQQPIASYDHVTGDLFTTLPLETADVGDDMYADVRLWLVDVLREEVPFQPRFFSSPNRAKWEHVIEMKNAGVVLIRGRLLNTRGIRSDYVTVVPVGGDEMAPAADGEHASPWPHRIRTLGGHAFQFPFRDLPISTTENAFQTVRAAEPQPFEVAYAEVTGGVSNAIGAPPGVSAIVPTELRSSGTITLGGSIDEDSQIEVRIEGGNELQLAVWVARDWPDVDTLDEAAQSLTDWLNGGEQFEAYYSAEASGAVVSITAKIGIGGEIVTDVAGSVTATPDGINSSLGIMSGRKYAVAYRGSGFLSALSPISNSTGPTGSADRVEIKDIPVSGDERVTEIWLYATPDGRDEPFYRIAEISNGQIAAVDLVNEADLAALPKYTGAIQPAMDGPILVTLKKNSDPWCHLFIPSSAARSNEVHGFALDPIPEGTAITVDVDNGAEELDLTVHAR